ncbi:MAG: aspartyl/asparaginyl beta-hydroxylase domain-containing protein [Gemmataceae bacterium]
MATADVSPAAPITATPPKRKSSRFLKYAKKTLKRVVPFAVFAYFIPWVLLFYVICGFLDVMRNSRRTLSTIDRYFAGNGVFTWVLSPFNLLMDVLSLPYWNKGIYKLNELPERYRSEIQTLIDAAHNRNLVGLLEEKMGEKKRGMIFFQWYGKILDTSVDMPEFKQRFRYIRTIGVSIFNKKQSTGKHYGPLRVTYRVLYNVNDMTEPNVYIKVGNYTHRWMDDKLFIFDDTLQHQSVNESDGLRYCLFVDILRPSLVPWLFSGILTGIRLLMVPFRAVFYQHWTIIK